MGVTVNRLIRLASQTTGLTIPEINGPKRQRQYIRARMAIVHYALEAGFNLSDIGRRMGNREHNTIMNLRDKAKVWRGRDPLFDRIMDEMGKGVAAGRASRPILPFLFVPAAPKPEPVNDPEIDQADVRLRKQMAASSRLFLEALRAAA